MSKMTHSDIGQPNCRTRSAALC